MNSELTTWDDILKLSAEKNGDPPRRLEKTDEEWKAQLSPEEYQVTRQKGTELPFSSDSCAIFEPGIYNCLCCETPLFDASEKFDSGTGWPSFTQVLDGNSVAYEIDNSRGRMRVEVLCNVCDAHLGHVFPDGPEPSGLRYCMNAVALKKAKTGQKQAVFGGGCFWCTEAVFQNLEGVLEVASGYAGGDVENPDYRSVCSGNTGHAEVIRIIYDPEKISYADLLRVHFGTHDPTTLNRQGADTGTQYRSVIFYENAEERELAESILDETQEFLDDDVVTEIEELDTFFLAENEHQNFYADNPNQPYCAATIPPKLVKLRRNFSEFLKKEREPVATF